MSTAHSGYRPAVGAPPIDPSTRIQHGDLQSRLPFKPSLRIAANTNISHNTPQRRATNTADQNLLKTVSTSKAQRVGKDGFPIPISKSVEPNVRQIAGLPSTSSSQDSDRDGHKSLNLQTPGSTKASSMNGLRPLVSSTAMEDMPGSNTPSLVSGSSLSSQDSPGASGKTLRRKPSVIGQYKAERHQTSHTVIPKSQPATIGGPTLQASAPIASRAELRSRGQLHGKAGVDTEGVLPHLHPTFTQSPSRYGEDESLHYRPTPVSEASTTPSLTYSASPSTFSHTTSATSRTAYSPLVSASPGIGPRWFTSPQKGSGIVRPKTTESGEQSLRSGSVISHPFFQQSESASASNLPVAPTSTQSQVRVNEGTTTPPTTNDKGGSSVASRPAVKTSPVHPPELAHLNAVTSTSNGASIKPTRPTRNGTQNLSDQQQQSHIVQSNLPTITGSRHLRRLSRDDASPTKSGKSSSKVEAQSKVPAKVSQSPQLAGSSSKNKAIPSLPRLATGGTESQSGTARSKSQAPSPTKSSVSEEASAKRKTKFGFFSKKSKPDVGPEENTKSIRKGPVAGTGHEGYGKHAVPRGRANSSTSSKNSDPRSGSTGSTRPWTSNRKRSGSSSQGSDLDEFLQQRLTPVYMKGGGSSVSSRRGSTIDDAGLLSSHNATPDTPQTSTSVFDAPKMSIEVEGRPSTGSKTALDVAQSRGRKSNDLKQPLAASSTRSPSRRRLQKAQPKPVTPKSVTPKPDTPKPVTVTRRDPGESDLLPTEYALGRPTGAPSRPPTADSENDAATKAKKSGWSMFSKAGSSEKANAKWNPFQRSKSQPTEQESKAEEPPVTSQALQPTDPLQAHYISPEEEVRFNAGDLDQIMREAAVRADDSSSIYTDFEDLGEQMPEPTTKTNVTKSVPESALADTVDKPPPSKRDDTSSTTSAVPSSTPKTSRLPQVGRIPKVVSTKDRPRKLPNQSFSRPFVDAHSKPNMQEPSSAKSSTFPPSVRSMSPMKGDRLSQKAASQTSSGSLRVPSSIALKAKPSDVSVARQFIDFGPRKNSDLSFSSASGTLHFPTASTIAYGPGRNSGLSMEETWPELDDLIDNIMTPSEGSSNSPRDSNRVKGLQKPSVQDKDTMSGLGGFELFPQPPASRSSSPRKGSTTNDGPNKKRSNSFDMPRISDRRLRHKRSNSLPESAVLARSSAEESDLRALSQSSNDHGNMALFRFRVLMTSKWLSFGRLLFSPIHNNLGTNPDDRVLIMDGLGNRDWSYYCAESYPNAQIYSLGPSSTTSNGGSFGFGHLQNYRHFSYASMGTDFPFPKSFFTAVVFRFPIASSEEILRSTISECKRVLRPGGYLEISTLDLDMTNMGNVGRRAVMNLKLAMQGVSADVSLKSASDHMQHLLHRRGFENMSRCLVGVPAAGAISSPVEMELTSLARDESREGDESITKQVAQVGRWWYSRCYEGMLGEERRTMWEDGALLKECEELGTTFKLLMCHAQKPTCVKRRTVSL